MLADLISERNWARNCTFCLGSRALRPEEGAVCPSSSKDSRICSHDSNFYSWFFFFLINFTSYSAPLLLILILWQTYYMFFAENSDNARKNQEENKHHLLSYHPEITTVNILVNIALIKIIFKGPGRFPFKEPGTASCWGVIVTFRIWTWWLWFLYRSLDKRSLTFESAFSSLLSSF